MFLLRRQCLHATAGNHLRAFESGLPEQWLQPRLEFLVQIVEEYRIRACNPRNIGHRRLIQLAVATRPDDDVYIDVIAGDVGQHIADDTERRHNSLPLTGHRRSRRRQRSKRLQAAPTRQHQARLPIDAVARRKIKRASMEIPSRQPAASTMAGPDGRFA
jgi:hypothetical protein